MTVRVLVVDDEPDVEMLFRQQYRREVREGKYTLDFALSALAALAILDDAHGEHINLLVSDINMPGMSGLGLLPVVKTRRLETTALARGADEFHRGGGLPETETGHHGDDDWSDGGNR